ncbi:hypothetical protein B0H15DRAFT_807653 [Mycena belliarum]|uniref:Uncharacterized protein n=1 Tax=Mycena belliarum TaxID=1033014 RepID=A0AAD6TMY1_9AGAR|nr:hypothetical protein B0H15DRAFT_807653 [Mycena belliae]
MSMPILSKTGKKLSAHAIRNPGRAVKASRHRARLSIAAKATRALKAAETKRRLQLLEDDVDKFYEWRASEITRMAHAYSVTENTVRKMICNTTQYAATRAPTLRNAIIHDQSLKAKAEGDNKALGELQDDLADAVDAGDITVDPELLPDDEKKRLIDQLVAFRETKKRGVRATNKAAAMDGMAVANGVRDAILDLFERTGIRAFALFSRGSPDDAALPHCVDSDDALQFFQREFDISELDVLRAFERFCCTLDRGAKERNDVASVRKQLVMMLMEGLRKVCGDKSAVMSYDNYDYDIRQLKKCELLGWPDSLPLQRPSKLCAEDARKIRNGLRDGSIFWRRMSKTAHEELTQEHAGKRMKTRAPRSDRNKPRGPQKKGKGKKRVQDKRDDEESDTETSDDDPSSDEERSPVARPPQHTTAVPTALVAVTPPSTSRPALVDTAPSSVPPSASSQPASPPAPTLYLPPFNAHAFDPSIFDFDNIDFAAMPTLDLTTYKFADHDDNAAAALYGTPFLYPAVPSAGGSFSNTDTALYGTAFPGSAVPSAGGDFSNAGTGLYATLIPDPAVPGAGGIFLPADPPFIDSGPGPAIGGFSTADAAVGVFDSRPGAASTPSTSGGAPVLGMSASSNTGGAKRKAGDADGSRHRKKSRKSKSDATGDPDPDAPKVRKVRSDKGSTRGSKDGTENAPDPVARVRKVRSDKGKPRDKSKSADV